MNKNIKVAVTRFINGIELKPSSEYRKKLERGYFVVVKVDECFSTVIASIHHEDRGEFCLAKVIVSVQGESADYYTTLLHHASDLRGDGNVNSRVEIERLQDAINMINTINDLSLSMLLRMEVRRGEILTKFLNLLFG